MQILRRKEVSKKIGLSPVSIWRLEKAGDFPARVQLGPRAVGWNADDIERWLETRPAISPSLVGDSNE